VVLFAAAWADGVGRAPAVDDAAAPMATVAQGLVADVSCFQGSDACGLRLLQTAGARAASASNAEEEEAAESGVMLVDVDALDDLVQRTNASQTEDAEGEYCLSSAEMRSMEVTDPEMIIKDFNYAKPRSWAQLNQVCGIGPAQSPINIETMTLVPASGKLRANYVPLQERYVLNTGHNLECVGDFGTLTLADGREFAARQFHLHSPSEHEINGLLSAMELHLVHTAVGGDGEPRLAVVAVLFKIGLVKNPCIEKIMRKGVPLAGCQRPVGEVDFASCFKRELQGPSYSYRGSLTTPPCTEGVQFNILARRATITVDQYLRFKRHAYGAPANNRPTQPLNGRIVYRHAAR